MKQELITQQNSSIGQSNKIEQMELIDFTQARSTLKIKECGMVDIVQVLEKGMLLLGIKGSNLPDTPTMQYMVTEVKSQYTGLRIGELMLAFQLASRGKLDTEAETYQNFSVLYLNRMVSAYHRWAIKQVNAIPEKKIDIVKKEVTEEEIISISYESYKKSKDRLQIFMAIRSFEILHKRGLINFEPDEVIKNTEAYLQSQIIDRVTKKEINDILRDEDMMEMACRRMALSMYFDNNKE
jgi:hypothetical protein